MACCDAFGLTGATAQGLVPPPDELPAPDEEDDPELDPDEEEDPELEPDEDEELELDLPPDELDEPDELDPGRGAPELDAPDAPELEEVPELELVEPEVEPEELDPPEDPELDADGAPLELSGSDPAPGLEPPPESSAGDPEPAMSPDAEHPTATSTAPNAPIVFVRITLSTSDPRAPTLSYRRGDPGERLTKPRGGVALSHSRFTQNANSRSPCSSRTAILRALQVIHRETVSAPAGGRAPVASET